MNEQKNNGRGIFYGVIGVATLVVAIVGATFAYFTASADDATTITGDMATVSLSLNVTKLNGIEDSIVASDSAGLIPMSNGMVEAAVNNRVPCQDDNGNVVCQIYKITITNPSTAGQFVDGYVALKGGSGVPNDYANDNYDQTAGRFKVDASDLATPDPAGNGTTMRWAQVFETSVQKVSADTKDKDLNNDGVCQTTAGDDPTTPNIKETDYEEPGCVNQTVSAYSTAGTQNLGLISNDGIDQAGVTFTSIGNLLVGKNDINIRTANSQALLIVGDIDEDGICDGADGQEKDDDRTDDVETDYVEPNCVITANGDSTSYDGILTNETILGNSYPVIGTNYIRVSDHTWAGASAKESYTRNNDVTSALVFNHNLPAKGFADYYIVVWLTENGYNQTAGQEGITPAKASFFQGNVTFVSAQGSEVSATFTDYAKVPADTLNR